MTLNSPYISGSLTVTGNEVVTGSLTVLGGITGAITGSATSASYALSASYADTASFAISSSWLDPGYLASSASYAITASYAHNAELLDGQDSSVFATTGSNLFVGNQIVSGSITATGQIIAQTLNVQQVTSSIIYSSGSNIFGNSLANTQTMTGSVSITGSLSVNGALSGIGASFSGLVAVSSAVTSTRGSGAVNFLPQITTSALNDSTDAILGRSGNGTYNLFALTQRQYVADQSTGAVVMNVYDFGGKKQAQEWTRDNITLSLPTIFSNTITSTQSSGIFLDNTSGGTNATQMRISNTGGNARMGVESSTGGTIQVGTLAYAAVFGNQANAPTQFTTSGLTRMTIATSGNIGVNTTTPPALFTTRGAGSFNTDFTTELLPTDNMFISSEMTNNAYNSILQLVSVRQSLSTGNASNGFLGFSTVDDSNGEGIRDAGRIAIVNESPAARNSPTALSFWTNTGGSKTNPATERMRITNGGNVGINTNAPSYRLTVNNTADNTIFIATTANGNDRHIFMTDSSANALIRTGNSVDLRLGVNEDALVIKSGGITEIRNMIVGSGGGGAYSMTNNTGTVNVNLLPGGYLLTVDAGTAGGTTIGEAIGLYLIQVPATGFPYTNRAPTANTISVVQQASSTNIISISLGSSNGGNLSISCSASQGGTVVFSYSFLRLVGGINY